MHILDVHTHSKSVANHTSYTTLTLPQVHSDYAMQSNTPYSTACHCAAFCCCLLSCTCIGTYKQASLGKKGSQKSTNNASNGNTAAATAAAASTKSATAASDKAAAAASKAEALAERLEGLKLEKQAWAVECDK
eukprot:5407-Heterococcus_DN1.PRE.2